MTMFNPMLIKIAGVALFSIALGGILNNYLVTFILFLTSLTIANIYYTLQVKKDLADFEFKVVKLMQK